MESLDTTIEEVLSNRLKQAIQIWIEVFEEDLQSNEPEVVETGSTVHRRAPAKLTLPEPNTPAHLKPQLTPSVHEIVIENQLVCVEPPIEQARESWIHQLHLWLGVLCNLPKIRATKYKLQIGKEESSKTYKDLINRLPQDLLMKAYESIENRLLQAKNYCHQWLQYQTLFDVSPSRIYSQVGDDLDTWSQLLQEIKNSRRTFDHAETKKDFGKILSIEYAQVQLQVQNKYDFWHKVSPIKFL